MVILYKDPQGKKLMQEANVHLSDETAVTFAANKDGESDTIAIKYSKNNIITCDYLANGNCCCYHCGSYMYI